MRKIFHQYFRPSQDELKELWQQGLLIFDASVLLNVYGYSDETRDELVELFEKKAGQIRLPYQFGLEYARNRSTVIAKQIGNYSKVEKDLLAIESGYIAPKREHPFLSQESTTAFEAIIKELRQKREAMEKLIGSDPYAERIFDVFEGKVGKCPSREELTELRAEAQRRYDQGIPPGFADVKDKGIPDAYGDCIAWMQLIQIAKAENKGAILVIDDFKEDWWLVQPSGRTIGPRPELLEEFGHVTNQRFYMYTSESFLRAAEQFTDAKIREGVLEEVTQRLASQRANKSTNILKAIPVEGPILSVEKSSGGSANLKAILSGESAVSLEKGSAPSAEKNRELKTIRSDDPSATKESPDTTPKREVSDGG